MLLIEKLRLRLRIKSRNNREITAHNFHPISTIIEIQPAGDDTWYEIIEFNQSKITTEYATFNTYTDTFRIRIRDI